MCAPRLQGARVPLTVRPEEVVPRVAPVNPERSVDHDPGANVLQPVFPIHWMVLKMTLSSQDSRELFKGDGGIRWSLRLNNEMRMNAQDMCRIDPGAAHV